MAADRLPATCSAAELAQLLGISARTVRELAAREIIPRGERGQYPLAEGVAAYCRHLREQAAGRADAEGTDLVAERAKLAAAQRRRIELQIEAEERRLVNADQVKARFIGMVTAAKNRLLAVPSKAKSRIPTLTVADVEVLEALVAEALEELAGGDP